MALPISVTESTGPAAAEPEPTLTMGMVDFGFELSGPITAGPQVIEVTNAGAELHEFIVARLNPGTTGEEFLGALGGFIEGTSTEPPPGDALGGVQAMDPGGRAFFSANFAPGAYLVFCPIDDEMGGHPTSCWGCCTSLQSNNCQSIARSLGALLDFSGRYGYGAKTNR
ncbi:MAG: hypothetical protein BZY87_05435 [SAR202 cluster bacterium Io17-Chloro-G6]|nr:MAG: hypothetical protein BZY87_05435 [SAR202 cluster bacterium Io17-Chloro-G6]